MKTLLKLCFLSLLVFSLSSCAILEKNKVEKTVDTYWTDIEKGEWIQALAMTDMQTSFNDKVQLIDDKEVQKQVMNEVDHTMRDTLSQMVQSHSIQSITLNKQQTKAKVQVTIRYRKLDVDALKNQLYVDLLPYLMNSSSLKENIPTIGKQCRKDIQANLSTSKVVTKKATMTLVKKNGAWKIQTPDIQSVWNVLNASALVDRARFSSSLADIL